MLLMNSRTSANSSGGYVTPNPKPSPRRSAIASAPERIQPQLPTYVSGDSPPQTEVFTTRPIETIKSASGNQVEWADSELGACFRKMKMRKGQASAATAMARKIARIYYSLVKKGLEYEERGTRAFEERERERVIANHRISNTAHRRLTED